VDWSHELLSDEERMLFRRLAVFAGGWSLGAVEAVGAGDGLEPYAVLDLLTSLVDKSLVVAEEHGRSVRYRLLQTVRQYAQDRLAESSDAAGARDRHSDFHLALAQEAEPHLTTDRQRDWFDVLDADAPNLAAAIEWAAGADPDAALALCSALTFWWKLRGHFAPAELAFGRALDAASAEPSSLRARVLWARGYLRVYAGDYVGLASVEEALGMAEAVGDDGTAARALDVLATMQMFSDPAAARAVSQRSRELARAAGDDWCLIDATQIVGYTHVFQGDLESALAAFDEAFPLIERTGHREFLAWHWFGHAYARWVRGEIDAADELFTRCVAVANEVDEPVTRGVATAWRATILLHRGDADGALALLGPALERVVSAGGGMALGYLQTTTAVARDAAGDAAGAREQLEALVAAGAYGDAYALLEALLVLGELRRLTGQAADAAARARDALALARQIGNRPQEAVVRLLEARLALDAGEHSKAEALAHDALATFLERGYVVALPEALDVLAQVAAALHAHEEAARVLGAAGAARAGLGGLARSARREREIAAIAVGVEEALGPDAARAALEAGAELSLDDAVAWLRRARGTRKRPPGGWESLTPTELQVVELAAEGLTNPQIGERLFIARGTVKVHLSHVYAKLGVRNRSELAATAARRRAA
jgi:ATP/maltotriose-dependent transcriptional regulator MalT